MTSLACQRIVPGDIAEKPVMTHSSLSLRGATVASGATLWTRITCSAGSYVLLAVAVRVMESEDAA